MTDFAATLDQLNGTVVRMIAGLVVVICFGAACIVFRRWTGR